MNHSIEQTESDASWLQVLADQVRSMRFGVVQVTIHNRRVVQIERVERVRFNQHGAVNSLSDDSKADQTSGSTP